MTGSLERRLIIAAAQMGPVGLDETRAVVVRRLIALLRDAKSRGAHLVVFPELALTTFFPRWFMSRQEEVDAFFEDEMPGRETRLLFEAAASLNIAFYLGYAERVIENGRVRRFNTSVLVNSSGAVVGKYRKVHLPGHAEPRPGRDFQHLEKRYFEVGNFGFPVFDALGASVGMCLCNDRRWPETYRMLALQGAEMVLLGYNTPIAHTGYADVDGLSNFHNHLSMQAGAYQNSVWVVGSAKCGLEEGSAMIGQSAIIAPSGELVAVAATLNDEVITAQCDLAMGERYRTSIFDMEAHRHPEQYRLLVERRGPPRRWGGGPAAGPTLLQDVGRSRA